MKKTKIEVYEVNVIVKLKKELKFDEVSTVISSILDDRICKKLDSSYHTAKTFKEYCFDNFYKIETDGVYKEGKHYMFRIRSIRKDLCELFLKLEDLETDDLLFVKTRSRILPKQIIDKLYSLTPFLFKYDKGYWRFNETLSFIKEQIFKNSMSKYRKFTNTSEMLDIKDTFVTGIKLFNKAPIKILYKNTTFYTDKLEIIVKKDEISQEIAYMLLGVGIMNNTTRGYGFVMPSYVKKKKGEFVND